MVAWGKGAHAVEAFKFSLYLAIPAIMTVAVAQNDKNLFGVIDLWFIKSFLPVCFFRLALALRCVNEKERRMPFRLSLRRSRATSARRHERSLFQLSPRRPP
mgnify:CR=1 FL=1